MAAGTTHIIKKDSVAAAAAKRPNPSLLGGAIRVPKAHVSVRREDTEEETSVGLGNLLQARRASISEKPVEVVTVARPSTTGSTKKVRTDNEEDAGEPSAEEIEAAWQARLKEEVDKARQEGYEAGAAAVRDEQEAEVEATVQRLATEIRSVQDAWEDHLRDSSVRLVQLAFRLTSTILDAPLPDDIRRISETSIADAVERMADGVPVEVAVHPVSYLRLQEAGLEEQLTAVHTKLRWRSDANLKENEWIVQSDRSAIRRLEAELLDKLRRELALRDVNHVESELADDSSDADELSAGPNDPSYGAVEPSYDADEPSTGSDKSSNGAGEPTPERGADASGPRDNHGDGPEGAA